MLEIADIYEVNRNYNCWQRNEVNRNIRFLESKNWKYIISYRMKAGSKQFKEYVLDEKDYVNEGFDIQNSWYCTSYNKKRINGHFRNK